MKKTTKYFNQLCKQKYESLGFFREKSCFARIRGDVIQSFSLKYYRNVPECTVEFGIFPLCFPQPLYLDVGQYELDQFLIDENRWAWRFDPNSEKSMMSCIESISDTIDRCLLPFFEACSDCKSALSESIKLEELFEHNRQNYLQLIGTSDEAWYTWQEASIYDDRKFFMALKSQDWSYVENYLKCMVDHYRICLKEFDEPDCQEQPDGVRENHLDGLAEFSDLLERFHSGDFEYFDNLVKFNENETKKFLAIQYPKLVKKNKCL